MVLYTYICHTGALKSSIKLKMSGIEGKPWLAWGGSKSSAGTKSISYPKLRIVFAFNPRNQQVYYVDTLFELLGQIDPTNSLADRSEK